MTKATVCPPERRSPATNEALKALAKGAGVKLAGGGLEPVKPKRKGKAK